MTRLILRLFVCSAILGSIVACGGGNKAKDGDKLLAKVYDKSLYLSELEGVVPEGSLPADSIISINAYVQRWVQEQMVMYEAERNIPNDSDIDQLVRDYRASLVRFNFEEQIIASKLDSTVKDHELQRYYEENKDQFQLESTILKCQVLKLRPNAPLNEINKIWNNRGEGQSIRLDAYAKQWASLALLDIEKWYKLEDIAAILPQGTLTSENASSRREGSITDNGVRYFYRILESVQGKTTAPFDYIREQASKIILHKRKQDLLNQWKNDLLQKELRRENITIY